MRAEVEGMWSRLPSRQRVRRCRPRRGRRSRSPKGVPPAAMPLNAVETDLDEPVRERQDGRERAVECSGAHATGCCRPKEARDLRLRARRDARGTGAAGDLPALGRAPARRDLESRSVTILASSLGAAGQGSAGRMARSPTNQRDRSGGRRARACTSTSTAVSSAGRAVPGPRPGVGDRRLGLQAVEARGRARSDAGQQQVLRAAPDPGSRACVSDGGPEGRDTATSDIEATSGLRSSRTTTAIGTGDLEGRRGLARGETGGSPPHGSTPRPEMLWSAGGGRVVPGAERRAARRHDPRSQCGDTPWLEE